MSKLNGSVDLLAQAMKKVFSEAVEGAVEPLREDLSEIRDRMATNEKLEAGLKTTDENVQAQLAQNRKDIQKDFKEALTAGR